MVEGLSDQVDGVALDWDFSERPHAHYAFLRSRGRVHHVQLPTGLRAWLVTDYELGRELLGDERLRKAFEPRARILSRDGGDRSGVGQIAALNSHLLASDPPDHTRLRGLVSRAFTARRVASMEPQVERRVSALLDGLAVDVELDLLEELAFPLAIGVLGDLLGVPHRDLPTLRALIDALYDGGLDVVEREQTAKLFLDYLRHLLELHRANPGDGLVPELIRVHDASDRLSEDELLSLMGLLLTAGFETTANLIGNGLLHLLQHPDQVAVLQSDPDLVPAAVEELLRVSSPVHLSTPRFTMEAISCGDITIPAGEIVQVSLLAVNHDANSFAAPDELDVARERPPHLAFGHGIHYCLGAPLARLQMRVALRGLLARFGTISLASEPRSLTWRQSVVLHGLERLPVRLDADRHPRHVGSAPLPEPRPDSTTVRRCPEGLE